MNKEFSAAQGRQIRTTVAGLRAEGRDNGSDEFALVGYAARYAVQSHNLGGFRESIRKGAFSRSVRNQMQGEGVCALWNHDSNSGILGRTTAGTLTISEDEKGLAFRCLLDRNQELHRSIFSSVKRGDTNACSFAFMVPKGGQQWADGKDPETGEACAFRTLTDVDLIECSPCAFPAYPQTGVNARSKADYDISVSPADLSHALTTLRKLAQVEARGDFAALLRELRTSPKYPYGSPDGLAALNSIHSQAARCAELACFCSDLVNDTLDDWDAQEDDDDRSRRTSSCYPYCSPEEMKAYRDSHSESHTAISGAAESFAKTRLALSRCMAGAKPKK